MFSEACSVLDHLCTGSTGMNLRLYVLPCMARNLLLIHKKQNGQKTTVNLKVDRCCRPPPHSFRHFYHPQTRYVFVRFTDGFSLHVGFDEHWSSAAQGALITYFILPKDLGLFFGVSSLKWLQTGSSEGSMVILEVVRQ